MGRALARSFLLVGIAWLPAANAEVVASLGNVARADAVMRLLDQTGWFCGCAGGGAAT